MPKYKFGDIVLVRFHPAYGHELKKYRPAVIVRDLTSIDPRFAQIAPLTTKASKPQNRLEMPINHPALEKTSLLLCWYVMTFDISRLIHRLGKLNSTDSAQLKKLLSP